MIHYIFLFHTQIFEVLLEFLKCFHISFNYFLEPVVGNQNGSIKLKSNLPTGIDSA